LHEISVGAHTSLMPSPQNPAASLKTNNGMDTLVFGREYGVLQTVSEDDPDVKMSILSS